MKYTASNCSSVTTGGPTGGDGDGDDDDDGDGDSVAPSLPSDALSDAPSDVASTPKHTLAPLSLSSLIALSAVEYVKRSSASLSSVVAVS